MFYQRYLTLCDNAGLKPSTAATKAGFNKGTVSVWKSKYEKGEDVDPDQATVEKICKFFGCTEQYLRGIDKKIPTPEGGKAETAAALFSSLTPEQQAQALQFLEFLKGNQ